MKQAFNTYKMASWLLGEALDPEDPMNEDDELNLEDATESEEEDNEESEDEESEDENDTDADDAEAENDDLDLDTDSEGEEAEDAENLNNNELLNSINQKLDQLIDKQPDADEEFDLDISNPVCPCCGAHLNIIDNTADTEDLATGEDAEGDEDFDISALLDGEGPEGDETEENGEDSDLEVNGEPIEAMDDDFDISTDTGEDGYVSLEDEDEDEE